MNYLITLALCILAGCTTVPEVSTFSGPLQMPARQVSIETNGWITVFPTSETAQVTFDTIDKTFTNYPSFANVFAVSNAFTNHAIHEVMTTNAVTNLVRIYTPTGGVPTLAQVLFVGSEAGDQSVTNVNLLQARTVSATNWIGLGGSVIATNAGSFATSFMGYPRVTLTTNMITLVGAGSSATSFAPVLNLNTNTVQFGTHTSVNESFWFDLGAVYSGMLVVDYTASASGSPDGSLVTTGIGSVTNIPITYAMYRDYATFSRDNANDMTTRLDFCSPVFNQRYVGIAFSRISDAYTYIHNVSFFGVPTTK